MTRYALHFQYLGKNYRGSQKQPEGNTIQDKIEKALCTLIKAKTSTIFSGRTDTGVSAYHQVLHFDTDYKINKCKFINSMNGILPEDIRIFDIEEKDKTFHAQKSAKFRHYRYVIRNDLIKSPFDTNVFYYRHKLCENRMNEALKYLQGEHDFSAFKSQSENPAKVCNIYFANAKRSKDGKYIIIDIVGDRFLYNMVRTIVGTLLLIEKDNLEPLSMLDILKSKNRSNARATAEAVGLTLVNVGYKDCSDYLKQLNT